MIECNVYLNKPRELDGKKVYARFSNAFMEKETNHVFAEIPEDRDASEFASTLSGRVRNDQTGVIYECAHDVEDSPYTYTEVFPNPRRICAFDNTGMAISMKTKPYPEHATAKTYEKATGSSQMTQGRGARLSQSLTTTRAIPRTSTDGICSHLTSLSSPNPTM